MANAAPLAEWDLPPKFATLRRLREARMIKARMIRAGRRECVQAPRPLEALDLDDPRAAVKAALRRGAAGFDAVKRLALRRVGKRPPRLDLDVSRSPALPDGSRSRARLPRATVARTPAASHMCLVAGDAA